MKKRKKTLAKSTNAPARKRRPPARKSARDSTPAAAAPVDPVAVLEEIAGNARLKPTPRVAAALELLRFRIAMAAAQAAPTPKAEQAKKAEKADRFTEELNRKALEMLNAKGTA